MNQPNHSPGSLSFARINEALVLAGLRPIPPGYVGRNEATALVEACQRLQRLGAYAKELRRDHPDDDTFGEIADEIELRARGPVDDEPPAAHDAQWRGGTLVVLALAVVLSACAAKGPVVSQPTGPDYWPRLVAEADAQRVLAPAGRVNVLAFQAAVPKKNPTVIAFTCPDHALDNQHEVDVVEDITGRVVQTLLVGDPPLDANGDVTVTLSVQPVAFGSYHFVVRAVLDALKGVDSLPSDVWQRVPGGPGKPVIK